MSKLGCACGHTISDVAVPNCRKLLLFTDGELDGLCGASLERLREHLCEGREAFLCPHCGRLLVQWREGEPFEMYAPESGTSPREVP